MRARKGSGAPENLLRRREGKKTKPRREKGLEIVEGAPFRPLPFAKPAKILINGQEIGDQGVIVFPSDDGPTQAVFDFEWPPSEKK